MDKPTGLVRISTGVINVDNISYIEFQKTTGGVEIMLTFSTNCWKKIEVNDLAILLGDAPEYKAGEEVRNNAPEVIQMTPDMFTEIDPDAVSDATDEVEAENEAAENEVVADKTAAKEEIGDEKLHDSD